MPSRLLACLLAAVLASAAAAQPAPPPRPEARSERRLPADSSTVHVLDLPGRTLRFTAVAGSLPLVSPDGAVQAEIAFQAYRLDGVDPATRPVTFVVNGGPGASSAFLQFLAVGPWRLPLDGPSVSPSAAPATVPNGDTWLDFTDLVFIDPVGTGYGRAATPDGARDYYTVEGDIAALSAAGARWLRETDRLVSPKFFLGESYGGFRGPLLAGKLKDDLGIGLSGLVLVSPVFDFGWLSEPRWKPLEFATKLPSVVAAARERSGSPASRAALADAEAYASGEYLLDLLRGPNDADALGRVTRRVSELTGLDPGLVRERGGRLDMTTLRRALAPGGRVVSAYDGALTGLDADPTAPRPEADDPGLDALRAPLTSAAVDHLSRRLGWRVPNARYELLNGAVGAAWRFGGGRRPAESFSALRAALADDPRLRVLVVHGLTDLVTPYFASELLLRQVTDAGGQRARVSLDTYPGGHMFYTRADSRAAFRASAAALYEAALRGRGAD